jgi:DNA invertase Pin-like site-specific DNA recombinase
MTTDLALATGDITTRPRPGRSTSPKIGTHHLKRKAIVYVRQSSPQQVRDNKESTERQYALVHRAAELGWSAHEIEVIDDDQGLSGKSVEHRFGFQRLLAEVGLDHVGIILGLEMSRLARSNRDWHQLLELCGIFRTLLADQDGIYDPTDYNDRLLLGLKGTMSEAELHILRGRMNAGKLNKARRGELFPRLPVGYVKTASGEITFDPDEQVQAVIRLLFEKFEELGSASAVLRYFVRHRIQVGMRLHEGPNRGQLVWRHPSANTLLSILHHPMYAGAYVYGRRSTDPRDRWNGHAGRSHPARDMDRWQVLIQDKVPAYIRWDQFLAHRKQLDQNRSRIESLGAAREGLSLLGGLVRCGKCGHRMVVVFKNRKIFRYVCCQDQLTHAAPRCQSLAGRVLDELVAGKVLTVLEPAALELSIQAAADIQQERERLLQLWKQKLERARYEVERAFRQYDAAEPENRLVARELERRWEAKLAELRQLEADYIPVAQLLPTPLTDDDLAQIRILSSSIPDLWHAPDTSAADRQTIIRHLVERISVAVQNETEFVDVTIHWCGGYVSEHEIRRPVHGYRQLRDGDRLRARIEKLTDAGRSPSAVAEQLNREGFQPPNRTKTFTGRLVGRFLRENCRRGSRIYRLSELQSLRAGEWLLKDLARELGLAEQTLHGWRRKGWISGRQISGQQSHWILWADVPELERLRRLSQLTYQDRPYPKDLTIPRQPRQE